MIIKYRGNYEMEKKKAEIDEAGEEDNRILENEDEEECQGRLHIVRSFTSPVCPKPYSTRLRN